MGVENARCARCRGQHPKCDNCIRREQEQEEAQPAEGAGDLLSTREFIAHLMAVAYLHKPGIVSASYIKDDGTEVVLHKKQD
jgi:predicted hotdog family 3-hydroxylacyl-ACP dehydratase